MIGAIFGDIAGSTREFNNVKSKSFSLLPKHSHYTDDTLLIAATADTIHYIQNYSPRASSEKIAMVWRDAILALAENYHHNDWGCNFALWLKSDNPQPYNSYGNGALLRAIPIGLLAPYPEYIYRLIDGCIGNTHNSAQALFASVFLATLLHRLQRESKHNPKNIVYNKNIIINHLHKYNTDILRTSITELAKRKEAGYFAEDAKSTLTDAINIILLSDSFNAAIRNAIYIGGDSDTIAAVTGALATYIFGLPNGIQHTVDSYLQDNKELHYIIACAYAREHAIYRSPHNG